MKPTISVITVSLNAENTISDAIESVFRQDYIDYEYIFIDGGSLDSTNVLIDAYVDKMKRKGIECIHLSEKDRGIYDAMNKGIDRACGKWVYFLNADDKLVNDHIFSSFVESTKGDYADGYYGNTINSIGENKYTRYACPMEMIFYRVPYCHQGLFLRRRVAVEYKFDEKLRYLGDYEQALRLFLDKKKIKYLNMDIAFFNLNGISQKDNLKVIIEREKIQKKYNVLWKNIIKRYVRYFFVIIFKHNASFYSFYIFIKNITAKNLDKSI